MTPIKSVAMIKRSLEKAFVCKSHVMIMIHSKWCLLFFFHMFAMGRASHLFGWGGGGEEGVSKRKTKSCTRKEGEKLVHKEACENFYASLTYLGGLYNRNVREEILIFLLRMESVE